MKVVVIIIVLQVTDFNEDNDIGREVSNEKLDSLISGPSGTLRESGKVVNVRKEDVLLIVSYNTDKMSLSFVQSNKLMLYLIYCWYK